MKYYKLTDENNKTHGDTLWGENITHKASGKGRQLCTADVIHVYDHPLKAVMFNPIHASFSTPILWECKVRQVVADDHLKVGVKQCTTVKEIPLPEITTNQRTRFALLCALTVYKDESFVSWAEDWLSGKDRGGSAAESARSAALSAAWSAESAAWSAESARSAALSTESATQPLDFVALIKQAIKEEK